MKKNKTLKIKSSYYSFIELFKAIMAYHTSNARKKQTPPGNEGDRFSNLFEWDYW